MSRLEVGDIKEGSEYTYESEHAWPEYMNGSRVRVTKIFQGDGLTVAYDFASKGGTTGSGTMHMDHARSVLKPRDSAVSGDLEATPPQAGVSI